jgi:hypothetical protein
VFKILCPSLKTGLGNNTKYVTDLNDSSFDGDIGPHWVYIVLVQRMTLLRTKRWKREIKTQNKDIFIVNNQ